MAALDTISNTLKFFCSINILVFGPVALPRRSYLGVRQRGKEEIDICELDSKMKKARWLYLLKIIFTDVTKHKRNRQKMRNTSIVLVFDNVDQKSVMIKTLNNKTLVRQRQTKQSGKPQTACVRK